MLFSDIECIEKEIRLYCRAIENNEDLPVPGEVGLHTQAIVDTIYESSGTGRRCLVKNMPVFGDLIRKGT